jgi:hypothetical protein
MTKEEIKAKIGKLLTLQKKYIEEKLSKKAKNPNETSNKSKR